MGSYLMRAAKPVQPAVPAEVPDMASQSNLVTEMDCPQNQNEDADHPIPPVSPDMGPSPVQDVSNVSPL